MMTSIAFLLGTSEEHKPQEYRSISAMSRVLTFISDTKYLTCSDGTVIEPHMADICCPNSVLSVWSLMCKQAPSHHLTHTGFWAPWGRSVGPPCGLYNATTTWWRKQGSCQRAGSTSVTAWRRNSSPAGGRRRGPASAPWPEHVKSLSSCVLLEWWCFKECHVKERICWCLCCVWRVAPGRMRNYSWYFAWFFTGNFCHRPWTLL